MPGDVHIGWVMYEYIRTASTESSRSAPWRARMLVRPGATPQPGTIRDPAATARSCIVELLERLRVVRPEVDQVDPGDDRGIGDLDVLAHVGRVQDHVRVGERGTPARTHRRRRRAPRVPARRACATGQPRRPAGCPRRSPRDRSARPDPRPPPNPSRPNHRARAPGSPRHLAYHCVGAPTTIGSSGRP